MINCQTSDSSDHRLRQNVCAVVLPTNPTLKHSHIHAFAHVGVKRHQCEESEIHRLARRIPPIQALRRRRSLETVPGFEEVASKLLLAQRNVVDSYALTNEA